MSSTVDPPPLTGLRVLELAGLAPAPFAGMMLADFGASVLRIDRPAKSSASASDRPTPDVLARHKSSIGLDLKSSHGRDFLISLLPSVDVLIDPFRPGVLEKIGLDPESVLLQHNPRLIVARLTGFRRDGKYAKMAGHDINYIAVSGVLNLFGRSNGPPCPPANVVGDFAGGGAMCVIGILAALMNRHRTGRGQVVEANMVDGAAYLASMPRMCAKVPNVWDRPRGENLLDGGCPFYDVYETKDQKYIAVGALEPQFFAQLLTGLEIEKDSLPGPRDDRKTWPTMAKLFGDKFRSKTRAEWESVFDSTDACVTPVMTNEELEEEGFENRPPVRLAASPAWAVAEPSLSGKEEEGERNGGEETSEKFRGQGPGVPGQGWYPTAIPVGEGGDDRLGEWLGWKMGVDYDVRDGGYVLIKAGSKL